MNDVKSAAAKLAAIARLGLGGRVPVAPSKTGSRRDAATDALTVAVCDLQGDARAHLLREGRVEGGAVTVSPRAGRGQ